MKDQLQKTPLVPLVQADKTETALRIVAALVEGGLPVVEVVLRTENAVHCLEAVAKEIPQAIVGAGTVLSADQAEAVIARGATFVVSPGLDKDIVALCQKRGVEILPGTATPTEMMAALRLGLTTVKFFPAALSGGVPMLKAASSVFSNLSFMPTGGVTAENLAEYLRLPSVLACGGSWLTPPDAVEAGDFSAITELARQALTIVGETRQ